MDENIKNISDSEYEVMKVIWKHYPIKANDIVEIIRPHRDWEEKTVKTLINRLMKKGIITYEKDGKAYLYVPKVSESEYKKIENRSFLKRVYDGSVKAMFSAFIKDVKLSEEEIEELKSILEDEER